MDREVHSKRGGVIELDESWRLLVSGAVGRLLRRGADGRAVPGDCLVQTGLLL